MRRGSARPKLKKNRQMDQGIYVNFTTDICTKKLHVIQKIKQRLKSYFQRLHIGLYPGNNRSSTDRQGEW